MTILSIGQVSYDITCPIDNYPVEGTKYFLNEKIEAGGGTATNVACLLGKWGETSYLAGVIGSDDYANKIKKDLEQALVKTDFMETSYEVGTPLSVILVNKSKGTRTRFDVVGQTQPTLKKYDYNISPDVIFSDGKEYSATINALNKYPNAISIVDAGRVNRDLLELCKYVKYIVCSKGFAETVSGLKIDFNNSVSLVNVYKKLKDKYPNNNIIVTLEEMGALYTVNNEIKVMPGIKTSVVDPSCSGDIFHGAFAYCLANNFDMEKTISYANIAAGLSIGKMGGSTSIPTIKEVINYYNQTHNIVTPVEEAPKVEEKPANALPDIPDASKIAIPTTNPNNVDLGASFFGGAPAGNQEVATPQVGPTPAPVQPQPETPVAPVNPPVTNVSNVSPQMSATPTSVPPAPPVAPGAPVNQPIPPTPQIPVVPGSNDNNVHP